VSEWTPGLIGVAASGSVIHVSHVVHDAR
jgi:hypothetical protein